MKKLMMAAAIVCAAVMSQAATVDWQYTITEGTKTKNAYDGYTVYLMDAAKWAALSTVTADTFKDSSLVYGSTTFHEGSGKSTYSYQTLNAAGAKGSYATALNDSIVAEGGTLNVTYVLLDTISDPNEYYVAGNAALTGRLSTGQEISTGFLSQTQATVSGGTWTPIQDVPEPTSGVLLLLGMAGLALRRKQK